MKQLHKIIWKSRVPAKVWFTFSANWKDESLSNKEKKSILAAGVNDCEAFSFLYVEKECLEDKEESTGYEIGFSNVKVGKRISYNTELTEGYKQAAFTIQYSGYVVTDLDLKEDKEEIWQLIREGMENASHRAYTHLGEQTSGFRIDVESFGADYPNIDKFENGYCAITGATGYAYSGWGEWFNFPAENGKQTRPKAYIVERQTENA